MAGTKQHAPLQLKSFGIICRSTVKSVSKWTWPFCQQFVDTVHQPTLSLPTGTPLWPSATVFAQLPIDDRVLRRPPKDKQVYEHCAIEKTMRRMGLRTMSNRAPNPQILDHNRCMVDLLARARPDELSPTRHEK